MKEIIIKYLDSQYIVTLDTYASHSLFDKTEKQSVGLKTVLQSIIKIFDISIEDLHEIFDEWADKKAVEINNKIVDFQFKYFQKTGITLPASDDLIKDMLETDWSNQPIEDFLNAEESE